MTYEEFTKRYTFNLETDHLGEGGFGEVFKAYDTYLDKYVAIKQSKVKKGQENFTLQKEVELATKLPAHPNIAHYEACYRYTIPMMGTFDFGILQYYQEGNLSDLRKAGKINKDNLNQLLEGILSGLSHLHKHNIIHRDIKPANILIVKRGKDYIPKITDFGISKQGSNAGASAISNSLAGGTYSYAAPEQLKGERKMRRNVDLWSFGVIVYQLMTKKLPFEPTTLDTSSEAARNEVTSLILDGHIPQDTEKITPPYKEMVKRCLVVDKMDRVQTAQELIDILNGKEVAVSSDDLKSSDEYNKASDKTIINPISKAKSEAKTKVETNSPIEKKPVSSDNFKSPDEYNKPADKTIIEKPVASDKLPESSKLSSFSDSPKPKKKNKLLIPLISFAAVAIIVALFFILSPSEQADWQAAQEQNTKEAYQRYLADYPQGEHIAQAEENIAWQNAEQENKTISYTAFIKQYPQSLQLDTANKRIQKLQLDSTLALNNTTALRSYIQQYPQGTYIEDANSKLTELVVDSINNALNIQMVYVSGGTFTMGCTSEQGSDCYAEEKPTHSVSLSSYYIGKYEITQGQWKAVMGSNPSSSNEGIGNNYPVNNVSWYDIQKFISKLNQMSGKSYRLLTEAEWEFAARGGNSSNGYKYSGSNTVGNVAWYGDNSGDKTHPVGQKAPNELGIYDMSGNVWEWCSDRYGDYSRSAQTNPKGPSSGSDRVCRGGSWLSRANRCRAANRNGYAPDFRFSSIGFRLVSPK